MLPSRTLFPSLALLLLTIVVYIPVWRNDFIDLDDELYITANPQVTHGLTGEGFVWAFTTRHGNYWQPLSWLSLQLDAHLFSSHPLGGDVVLSPAAFHGQNLFWHAASVLLLFAVWQRLTGAPWCSFLVAGLFAVHPMHVESVAWAAERKDVLSTFFGLLTLWAYARYVEAPGWRGYLGVAGALLLSLMCKPMLITMPFVLLLIDYWPLQRMVIRRWPPTESSGPAAARPAWLIVEKVPLMVMAGSIAVLTQLFRDSTGSPVSFSELPLLDRLGNALVAYGWYIGRSFWPTDLAAFYVHPVHDWSRPAAVVGAALLLLVTTLAFWQARRRRWFIVGWLWFIGTLLPVIGFSQGGMQAWADRFSYWPHIGLAIVVAWGLAELAARARIPVWISGAGAGLGLGALAMASWIQIGYWRDTPTVWERVLAVTENNHRAYLNLGNYYMERHQFDAAAAQFAECVRIRPDSVDYRYRLGAALLMLGREEEAAEQFAAAIQRTPNHADAWYNLGVVRLRQGQPEKAARAFRKAAELQPELSQGWAMLGKALLRLGQRDEALAALHTALSCNPQDGDAWHGLGLAALAAGQVREAVEDLTQGVQYDPKLVGCYSDLGVALGRAGRWAEALPCHITAVRMQTNGESLLKEMGGRAPMQDGVPRLVIFECRLAYALNHRGDYRGAAAAYRSARERDSHWPDQFAARAWTLLTDPNPNRRDPQTAYELARQATDAVGDPPAHLLDVFAAAEAARGDFAAAAQTAQRALDKASAAGDVALAKQVRDHLRLYEQRKPVSSNAPERQGAGDS